jgi:hypothetical protein
MNGYPDQQPSLNLPPVNTEVSTNNKKIETNVGVPEYAMSNRSANSIPQGTPPLPALPISDNSLITVPQTNNPIPAPITNDIPRDEGGLIPKEWVIKAKTIIIQTREDPYSQNRALTKIKADYIRDRYNMSIKVDD